MSRPIAEKPIRSKPVAVIGASTGAFGAVWAQRELKKVLGLMGARVLDAELAVAKADRRLAEPDSELREQLDGVVSSSLRGRSRADRRVASPGPRTVGRLCETRGVRVTMLLADFAQVSTASSRSSEEDGR